VNFRRLMAVWIARNLEFLRDRSTLIFNFLFPLALVIAFAVIFGGEARSLFKIGVIAEANATLDGQLHPFLGTKHVDFYAVDPAALDQAVRKVERHEADLLLDLRGGTRYWVNTDSPKGYLAEKLLLEAASGDAHREPVTGGAVRYVDWLLPGILGMNMMFSCLFGVGYVVVRYRKSGFLRRLSATPVTATAWSQPMRSRTPVAMATATCAETAPYRWRVVTATPSSAGPFAAQSRDEPAPYSRPAMTMSGTPRSRYASAASKIGITCPPGCSVVTGPSVPGAMSFFRRFEAKVPRSPISWLPRRKP